MWSSAPWWQPLECLGPSRINYLFICRRRVFICIIKISFGVSKWIFRDRIEHLSPASPHAHSENRTFFWMNFGYFIMSCTNFPAKETLWLTHTGFSQAPVFGFSFSLFRHWQGKLRRAEGVAAFRRKCLFIFCLYYFLSVGPLWRRSAKNLSFLFSCFRFQAVCYENYNNTPWTQTCVAYFPSFLLYTCILYIFFLFRFQLETN